MLPCMHKSIFGVECLGCGIQRSLFLIAKGEFAKAFRVYPPIYSLLVFLFFILLHFLDKKRKYNSLLLFFGILTAVMMLFSFLYKQKII